MARPSVIGCNVFGGRSPLTGKPVGERHRWSGGKWGEGRCEFCGRNLEDVLEKPKKELTLEQAIAKANAEAKQYDWTPVFDKGEHRSKRGWYAKRKPKNHWGTEWLHDHKGKLVVLDTRNEIQTAIDADNAASAALEKK